MLVGGLVVLIAAFNLVFGGLFLLVNFDLGQAMVAAIPFFLMWLLYKWGIKTFKTDAPPFHSRINIFSRTGIVSTFMFFLGIVVLMSERQKAPYTDHGNEELIIVLVFTAIGVVAGLVVTLVNNFVHAAINNNGITTGSTGRRRQRAAAREPER